MSEKNIKYAIMVLGAGRCGTSLLMQILSALSMSLSEDLVAPRAHNKNGPMEDADLANIYDTIILPETNSSRSLPLDPQSLSKELKQKVQLQFKNILNKNIEKSDAIWGFKDPFSTFVLPLWFRVFNMASVVPVFLLAVRHPAQSVVSRRKHFDVNESLGELAWLVNFCEALHHIDADCYIVHYEEWFTRPTEVAQDLLAYTGLDQYYSGNVDEALNEVIKPNMNRAVYEDYEVQNEYVLKLYEVLKNCRGDDFDRDRLMDVAKECKKAIHGFKGWYMQVYSERAQISALMNKFQDQQRQLAAAKEEITTLRTRVQETERQASRVSSLENELKFAAAAQTLIREELLRSEAQLELIKDLLWGSSQ